MGDGGVEEWWGVGGRRRGVVVVGVVVVGVVGVVVVEVGVGVGAEVEVRDGLLGCLVGWESVDVVSLVGEEERSGFDLRGVLKGDLKGWDRVFVAVFRRRRFEGWMGDMVERVCIVSRNVSESFLELGDLYLKRRKNGTGASDALRVSTSPEASSFCVWHIYF